MVIFDPIMSDSIIDLRYFADVEFACLTVEEIFLKFRPATVDKHNVFITI